MIVKPYDSKTIRISWETKDDNHRWDKACIYALQTFGLPGHRFETHSNEEWMDFEFKDPKDALMFLMGVSSS
jgi:hypothetical protein